MRPVEFRRSSLQPLPLLLASIALVTVFLSLDGFTAPTRLAAAGREIANTVGWIRGEATAAARSQAVLIAGVRPFSVETAQRLVAGECWPVS